MGCSKEETTVQLPPEKYQNSSEFCDELATQVCNAMLVENCYNSSDSTLDDDTEACIESFIDNGACNPNSLPYHAGEANAQACIDAWKEAYADARLEADEMLDAELACLKVFNRGYTKAAACTADHDCDVLADLKCVKKPGEAEGQCYKPEYVGGGDECTDADQQCNVGYFCDLEFGGYCHQEAKVNEACFATKFCVASVVCGTEEPTVCIAKFPNGSPCTANEECLNGFCVKAAGAANGTCGASLNITATSAACEPFL
jgi:hypothetical protein